MNILILKRIKEINFNKINLNFFTAMFVYFTFRLAKENILIKEIFIRKGILNKLLIL